MFIVIAFKGISHRSNFCKSVIAHFFLDTTLSLVVEYKVGLLSWSWRRLTWMSLLLDSMVFVNGA